MTEKKSHESGRLKHFQNPTRSRFSAVYEAGFISWPFKKHDRKKLSNYYVNDFIKFIGMSRINFFKVLKKYTNKKIWNKKNYKSLKDF